MSSLKKTAAAAALVLVAGGAWAATRQPTPSPQQVVREVFEAAKRGRCEEVRPLLTRAYRERLAASAEACPELLDFLTRHPVAAFRATFDDGRRARSKIVQVALRDTVVPRSLTLDLEAGQWRLAAL